MTKVVDRDLGWSKLMRTWRKLAGTQELLVGVQGPEADSKSHDGPITNVGLAVVHEFGVPERKIPERSFLRSTMDKNIKVYRGMYVRGLRAVTGGRLTPRQVQAQIGGKVVSDVKRRIASAQIKQDLKPRTIAERIKRGLSPGPALQATTQLRDSITWVIR